MGAPHPPHGPVWVDLAVAGLGGLAVGLLLAWVAARGPQPPIDLVGGPPPPVEEGP
jgi:hypothetical protein